jgi:hypothetical protein
MDMIQLRKVIWSLISLVSAGIIIVGIMNDDLVGKIVLVLIGIGMLWYSAMMLANAIMDDWFNDWE